MSASVIFALGAIPLYLASAALAWLRYRGKCVETLVGAWACGLAFCAAIIISGAVAFAEAHPSPPSDWRRSLVSSCIYQGSSCDAGNLAAALKLGESP